MSRKRKEQVRDDAPPDKYFHMIYNMADDDLGPFEYKLYGHYRRVCGKDGACWESTRATAEKCKMSVGKVSQARRDLAEIGYIRIEDRGGDTLRITLVDLMAENTARYAGCSPDERECSPHEQGVHRMNTSVHHVKQRKTTEEKPIRKTIEEKPPPQTRVVTPLLTAGSETAPVVVDDHQKIFEVAISQIELQMPKSQFGHALGGARLLRVEPPPPGSADPPPPAVYVLGVRSEGAARECVGTLRRTIERVFRDAAGAPVGLRFDVVEAPAPMLPAWTGSVVIDLQPPTLDELITRCLGEVAPGDRASIARAAQAYGLPKVEAALKLTQSQGSRKKLLNPAAYALGVLSRQATR